jgi:hypothetical protein
VKDKTKYEVRRQRGAAWDTLRVFDKEEDAKKFADTAFSDRNVAAVNVVRDWTRADGMHIEKIVHALTRTVEDKPVQIQAIEDVGACDGIEEFYNLNARLTMARLLKQYLDDQAITVTEILHSFRDGKRLMDKDNLISAGVGMVANLQAKGPGASERRKAIYDTLDQMLRRARDAESLALPDLKEKPLFEALASIAQGAPSPEERNFRARVMMTRHLSNGRGYLGKLEILMTLLSAELPESQSALLDGIMADICQNTAVVQEILGNQPNLAGALVSLIDLATGKLNVARLNPDSMAVRLNQIFEKPGFDDSRYTLLDWVKRQLKGTGPLNRRDPAGENDAFMVVFKRLSQDDAWTGGPTMTEALTLRFARRIQEGGATGRRKAIKGMLDLCDQPTSKLAYLMALIGSDMAVELRSDILMMMKDLIQSKDSVQLFFGRNEGIADKLRRVTNLFIKAGTLALEPSEKDEIRERLDDLLARYVVEAKIVEAMDDATKSLRIRAMRLVQFCTSGALVQGRALKLAQQRVIEQLRQPNFERAFVADLPDEKSRATALTDFFVMLKKAGLA